MNIDREHAYEILSTYGLATYARPWTWQRRPKGYRLRTRSACYGNAGGLALNGRGTYVEGWVGWFQHAWVIDDRGGIIETTPGWPIHPGPYIGVPFVARWRCRVAVNDRKWWTVLHHATNAIRDGTPVGDIVDLEMLARFDRATLEIAA